MMVSLDNLLSVLAHLDELKDKTPDRLKMNNKTYIWLSKQLPSKKSDPKLVSNMLGLPVYIVSNYLPDGHVQIVYCSGREERVQIY